ncbi:MAG: ABC transporter ATP-binding protein [Magnetococcus sp. DMHC-6]
MAQTAVIRVQGVWKRYGLPLLPAINRGWRQIKKKCGWPYWENDGLPWALQGVSFDVQPGETLGLIGRNGSGKSTMLKLLAGVTPPTHGHISIHGSMFPMIELNAGVHMELTGRENIRLLGSVVGLSRKQIQEKMGLIEAFCELGEWLDRPVRMYSSGMMVRLGFAVGVHVNAEILLMDEVLAVGDLSFHNKCMEHLEALRSRGRCTLFVSHNMHRVRRMCDRVLVLDKGRPIFLGDTEEGVALYEKQLSSVTGQSESNDQFDFLGISLQKVAFVGEDNRCVVCLVQGEDARLRISFRVTEPMGDVTLHVSLLESVEAVAVVFESIDLLGLAVGLHHFEILWRQLRLKAGGYAVRIGMSSGVMQQKGFRMNNALRFQVEGDTLYRGLYQPEMAFRQLAKGMDD